MKLPTWLFPVVVAPLVACAADASLDEPTLDDLTQATTVPVLVTTPTDPVVHVAAVGGAVTHPTTTYTITAPATATASASWTIAPPTVTGAPLVTVAAPLTGTLAPGASHPFTVSASASSVSTCGTYSQTVTVTDTTHGVATALVHRFEIGLTELAVTPDADYVTEQLVPPYGETKTYTVSNPRPTSVSLRVAVPAWITLGLNGGSAVAGPLSFTLAAYATAQVTLHVSVSGELQPLIPLDGDITFTNLATTCKVTTVISHHLKLTPGKHTFSILTGGGFPDAATPPATFGPPVTIAQTVPDDVVLDSVTVDAPVYSDLIGSELAGWKLVLTAPSGKQLVLWDRTTGTVGTPSLTTEYLVYDNFAQYLPVLHFSDAAAPPPTGAHLATLIGDNGHGTWQLSAYAASSAGWVALLGWRLNLTGHRPCGVDTLPPCTTRE